MTHALDSGDEGSRAELLRFLAEQGEEPAFLRRAKAVEEDWAALMARCLARREEMLRWARMRLADLERNVVGDWARLAPLLADARQAELLAATYDGWKPQMPAYVTGKAASGKVGAGRSSVGGPGGVRSSSPWATVRSSLVAFVETVQRFNEAWDKFLASVDLSEINRQRADYNKYYPIEKSAAFDTQDIERLGFTPMEMATVDDLRAKMPPVDVPAIR